MHTHGLKHKYSAWLSYPGLLTPAKFINSLIHSITLRYSHTLVVIVVNHAHVNLLPFCTCACSVGSTNHQHPHQTTLTSSSRSSHRTQKRRVKPAPPSPVTEPASPYSSLLYNIQTQRSRWIHTHRWTPALGMGGTRALSWHVPMQGWRRHHRSTPHRLQEPRTSGTTGSRCRRNG